jgi:nuclear transport factor 2 (NTF2) superfamily protein
MRATGAMFPALYGRQHVAQPRRISDRPTGDHDTFLQRKWVRELDYRLIKELWAFHEARIAVRFAYEWRDESGHWFRSWQRKLGVRRRWPLRRRIASINDLPITEAERKYRWPLGRRPDDHPGLSDLGL